MVDDSPENIQILVGILRDKGYDLSVATNGRQAIEVAGKVKPDLILLDVVMPEMDGYETCRHLKSDTVHRNTPVIFLTSRADSEDIVAGFEAGAVDYVAKPFNAHELLARIGTHLTLDLLRRSLADKIDELAAARARELEAAYHVQSQLIPATTPSLEGWDFAATWKPAKEVSGDFYDFIEGSDRLGVTMADVSGKGMHAALFMANARSILRSKLNKGTPCAVAMKESNALICRDATPGMFVTVFYGEIDYETREFAFVNCGHNPTFWYRASTDSFENLEASGAVMGVSEALPPPVEAKVKPEPGDILFFYTDGITEAFNVDEEEFGEERVLGILSANRGRDAKGILDALEAELDAFVGEAPQSDDRTMVVIKAV
jgi:CheY-like chemotaxis protein